MISLLSPAKLNLFFRVIKKRDDGFYEIISLFQAISLCDELTLQKADKDQLICQSSSIPVDQSNLIFRAIGLLRQKIGLNQKFKIELKKRIPVAAGLGGGSSNAATILWGINQLLNLNLEEAQLAKWGAEIGSDVSFFFSHGRALCKGRGEILINEPKVSSQNLWIAKPKFGLSTSQVYKNVSIKKLPLSRETKYYNDLEYFAFSLAPELKTIKKSLLELGFTSVTMTGSGSAFFCFGEIKEAPKLEGIQFSKAQFLYRRSQHWYHIHHEESTKNLQR